MHSDYREQKHFRRLERLLTRILDLDQVLREDTPFDKERARALQEQIRCGQKKLDAIYDALDLKQDET